MVDYKKDTGSTGEMMIRDNGTTVSFLINTHNDFTSSQGLPWGYTLNGVTNNDRESPYSVGAGWVTLGSWTVTSDQTVTFRLFGTSTTGLGGPTTLSASIDRSSAPSAPDKPIITNITMTTMRIIWAAGASNGAAIDLYQVSKSTTAWATDGSLQDVGSDRIHTFTGLTPGTKYYYWARTHNAKGYSPWSPAVIAYTLQVPAAPDQVVVSDPSQVSFVASFTDNSNNGSAVVERQLAYNTINTITGAVAVSYSDIMIIDELQVATTYYVWARVRNAAGWSAYSPVATIRTIAGAWMNVDNVWKEAIPYVKDGGVWKLARPWCRVAEVWKEAT